jgi:hypothetical protein
MPALIALIRAEPTPLDAPLIPGSWERSIAADHLFPNRWSIIYPFGRADGRFFHARLILRDSGNPQRAVFVCTGTRAILDRLAERIAADGLSWTRTWLTLQQLRDDAAPAAAAIRAAWPDERLRDSLGNTVGMLVAHWKRIAGAQGEDAET